MHGEYKTPGGKLVVVDLEVEEDRIASARVSGDFFLEPDAALSVIDVALAGQPIDAKVSELRAAIDYGLQRAEADGLVPGPVTLVGFSSEAVAIAVRRAVGKATGWEDHIFDVIHDGPQSPAMHMALDQTLAESTEAGLRGPSLRIWEWGGPSVIIGSFQSLRNEVDAEGAKRHGIEVVRRISGGGAMFVEPGNTITYSLVVPSSLVDGLSYEQSYAFLDDWVLGALGELGINAVYKPINDIASPAGKIAGAAQKRLAGGTVLHHVTMAYDIDADKMLQVLRIGREKLSDKGTKSANKRVDPLRSQTGLPRAEIIESFKTYFASRYRIQPGAITEAERQRAAQLVAEKFSTPEWTARVP